MTVLAKRPNKAKQKQRFFQIQFTIEQDNYVISTLPCSPEVARKAFRFRKLTGDQATYDVRVTEYGPECECLGFLRHSHCKHAKTLVAASSVFSLS